MIRIAFPIALLLLVGACAEKTCTPPRADWAKTVTPDDILLLDSHDRIVWNGEIISFERLRDTLNKADAEKHIVRLSSSPATTCAMIEKVRLAMDRSLSCVQGRCTELPVAGR